MELSEPLDQPWRQGRQDEIEATKVRDLTWHWRGGKKGWHVFEKLHQSLGREYSYPRRKGLE